MLTNNTRSLGQGLVEYVIILGLVALVTVAILILTGTSLGDVFRGLTELTPGEEEPGEIGDDEDDGIPTVQLTPATPGKVTPLPSIPPIVLPIPTRTPAPADGFFDDFTGCVETPVGVKCPGWRITDGSNWYIRDNQLCAGPSDERNPPRAIGDHRAYTGDESWKDYEITLVATLSYPGSGREGGFAVLFRMSHDHQGQPSGYAFQYDPGMGTVGNQRPSFLIRRVTGHNMTGNIIAQKAAPSNWVWYDVARHIRIVVNGPVFIVYIDGVEILSVSDTRYSSGYIGLRNWHPGAQTCFDEIRVRLP